MDYFNNKVLCDLIESKPKGILAQLDDMCVRPGKPKDSDFLDQMEDMLGDSQYFESFKTNHKIRQGLFVVKHYAGDVTYNVDGFIDKNNDRLYRDLIEVFTTTSHLVVKQLFSESELDSKKRPPTAGHQFKVGASADEGLSPCRPVTRPYSGLYLLQVSMNALVNILLAKSPSYVRCIKPNDNKKPGEWDNARVHHQVKYLGLLENLRVTRAGFAYRRQVCLGLWTREYTLCFSGHEMSMSQAEVSPPPHPPSDVIISSPW